MPIQALNSLVRRLRPAAALGVLASAALAPAAHAGPLLNLAALTKYNSTPDCPVSADHPICGPWNVPVDVLNVFGVADYGQCTYWAAEKYPNLVLNELLSDPLGSDWNGSTWGEHAAEEGLPVITAPAPGDLAVWGATSSDPSGHVAYVETVNTDGSVIVSQMDGDTSAAGFAPLEGTTEYLSSADISYYRQAYNLEFVDTGDTDTGTPSSYVQEPAAPTAASSASASPVIVSTGSETSAIATSVALHYRLSGRRLTISSTLPSGGSLRAVATLKRRTVRFASSWWGQDYTLTGNLAKGQWAIKVIYENSGVDRTYTARETISH